MDEGLSVGECKCESAGASVGISYHAHPFEKSHDGKLRRKVKERRRKGDGEG